MNNLYQQRYRANNDLENLNQNESNNFNQGTSNFDNYFNEEEEELIETDPDESQHHEVDDEMEAPMKK